MANQPNHALQSFYLITWADSWCQISLSCIYTSETKGIVRKREDADMQTKRSGEKVHAGRGFVNFLCVLLAWNEVRKALGGLWSHDWWIFLGWLNKSWFVPGSHITASMLYWLSQSLQVNPCRECVCMCVSVSLFRDVKRHRDVGNKACSLDDGSIFHLRGGGEG